MARTQLNETYVARDTAVDTTAAGVFQSADNTNGMYISGASTAISGQINTRKSGTLLLHVKNGNAAACTVTLRAGSGKDVGPGWRATLGDLTFSVPATTGSTMFKLHDTARFAQSDGSLNIDFSVGSSVTVAAFREAGF